MRVSAVRALRWLRNPPALIADSMLTVLLMGLAAYEYANPGDDGHQAGPLWLNAPLSVLFLLPLAWRRRAPMPTFLIAHAVVAIPWLVTDHTLFAFSGSFVLGIYLYTVARHCPIEVARWAPLVTIVTLATGLIHGPRVIDAGNIIFGVLLFGICWLLGRVLRSHFLTHAALRDAMERLDREQSQRERLAVLDERTRLARDLHDVVAHAVALMLVQAGAARLALDDDTDASRAGLLAVERTGRQATGDLRRLLGLLRTDDGDPSLLPREGLDGLPELLDRMRHAGLDADLEVVGEPGELPASLSVSALRIVQESLTNVLKHAGPTRVRVRVDYGDPLCIDVVDDGPTGVRESAPAGGHGLLSMRERVALFGGRLHAARAGRGFAVRAELPLPDRTGQIA